mgnify:CR=1 FL=1
MKPKLSNEELEFIRQKVVRPLNTAGYQVWCFGSRARGEGSRYADVDLLIEGPGQPRALLSDINEQLIDSNFPYKVDLVLASDLAKSYWDGVMADRILLNGQ